MADTSEMSQTEWSDLNESNNNKIIIAESQYSTELNENENEWELLSESHTNATNLTNPINHIITDNEDNDTIDEKINSINNNDNNNNDNNNDNDIKQQQQPPTTTVNNNNNNNNNNNTLIMPQISEDNELPTLPILNNNNNNNNNGNINDNNDEKAFVSIINNNIDIESELERQRAIVENLRQRLTTVTQQRDQVSRENRILEEKNFEQKNEIIRLNNLTIRLNEENNNLRELTLYKNKKYYKKARAIESNIKQKKESKNSKYNNKNGGKHNNMYVPSKLRFKRQRTNTRKVFTANRHW